MVSNDDIPLLVENTLELKIADYSNISSSSCLFTVPSGKRWILKGAILSTDANRNLQMSVRHALPSEEVIIEGGVSVTEILYKPGVALRLPPGGAVLFQMSTAGPMAANLLYEEETEY